MKETLRITSAFKETELDMRSLISGRWEILTEDFYWLSDDEHKTNPEHKNKKIWKIYFTPTNKHVDIEYEIEDLPLLNGGRPDEANGITAYAVQQSRDARELNKRKRQAKEFITKHWQLTCARGVNDSHKPTGHIIGHVELLTQKRLMDHKDDRKKALVFFMVDSMTAQEQLDLAMYYAPWLFGKRRSEIVQGLVGLEGGILWKKNNVDDFLERYSDNPTVAKKVYVQKAIAHGIITKGQNGYYVKGNDHVGADVDEIVVRMNKDTALYTEHIQPAVNAKEVLPDDDLAEIKADFPVPSKFVTEKRFHTSREAWKAHYGRLAEELKTYTDRFPMGIKTRDLELLVGAYRQENAKTEKDAKLPTHQLEVKVDPAVSDDMAVLKEEMKSLGIKGWQNVTNPVAAKAKIALHRESAATQE